VANEKSPLPDYMNREYDGKKVCQYWVDEPGTCPHWDKGTLLCTYTKSGPGDTFPSAYPYCNRLGTRAECSKYAGTGTKFICILPDPQRHVGRRWLPRATVSGIGPTIKWQRSWISEYNEGACDSHGTATTCSGYSPYHMGFSLVEPEKEAPWTADETALSTIPDELSVRLPLYFDVRGKLRERFI